MRLDFSHTRIIIRPRTTNMLASREQLLETIKTMIWWDRTGFWVAQKKLEKGQWPWPNTQEEVKQLNLDQIEMLLKGVDFFKGHEELFFSEIN